MFSSGQSLHTGNLEIDQSHEALDQLVKNVERTLITNAPVKEIHKQFLSFIAATKSHFKREEDIFEKSGVSNLNEHKAEHRRLMRLLMEVEKSISETEHGWRQSIVNLADILTRHIITYDFEIKHLLKS